jgi:hypothetical protein
MWLKEDTEYKLGTSIIKLLVIYKGVGRKGINRSEKYSQKHTYKTMKTLF